MSSKALLRDVLRIAWPIVISELGDSLYSIADTYFVSRLGTEALASVALGSYLSWLFFVVVVLFSVGILIYSAQSYGAGDVRRTREALGTSLIFGSLTASIASLTAYLTAYEVVRLISGNSGRLALLTSTYFKIRILGLPALSLATIMDSVVRAVGATKLSMIAILSSNFLNIALDPLLIYGLGPFPKMGVVGAALATVISVVYMIPLELYFLKYLGLVPLPRLHTYYLTRIVKIGVPAAVERLIFSLGSNAYVAFIARCGDVALAAHQVGVRIESFIYMPGFAFSIAASALVGQEVGRGDLIKARSIGIEAAKLSTLFMGSLGIFIALASKYLVLPFSPSPNVAELASIYLILSGLSEPGLALAMTFSGAIRGGGNTIVPLILNAVILYSVRVVPSAFLTKMYGVVGAWIAMFSDVYVRGLAFTIIYIKFFTKISRRIV